MWKDRSLAFKLSVFILFSTALIFLAAFGYSYRASRASLLKNVELQAQDLTLATVYKIEAVLQAAQKVPENLAALISLRPLAEDDLLQMMRIAVRGNPEIFGMAVAFEPYTFDPKAQYFAPYCYREGRDQTAMTFIGGEAYHYFTWDWYQIPKELNSPAWTEPYYDEGGGNIVMATYAVPFYRETHDGRKFQGVVTADVSLKWLADLVSSVKIYDTGYAFLLSANGVFITHPKQHLIMRESVFSLAESLGDQGLRRLGQTMLGGERGFARLPGLGTGVQSWMYYAPLPSSRWTLGVIFPERELFADIQHLSWMVAGIGAAGFVLLFLAIVLISGTITRPLRFLAATTHEIARGNLDIQLPTVPGNDEIGRLTRSFGDMKTALKEYIADLAVTTAAKERIESELKIARTIQMSFLPRRFPPFPEQHAFEIFGALEPAKEVGGDFYDFFLLGPDHLFVAVGDVSDKGVPAALFMAVTKTLLKGVAEPDLAPSEVLNRVNLELCRDNDSMMFVTVFCALLNHRTGELAYTNAGHNPPVLIAGGRAPARLDLPKGFLLGAFEESRYRTQTILLTPGDTLVIYTDGVTEAMDRDQRLYSEARLQQVLAGTESDPTEQLVGRVMTSVHAFAQGAPQSDDITVLALRFKGPGAGESGVREFVR